MVRMNGDLDKAFASKYRIEGFPSMIFLNKDGQEVHRFAGYMPYSDVIGQLNIAKGKF